MLFGESAIQKRTMGDYKVKINQDSCMESLKDLKMEMFQSHLMMNAKLIEAPQAEDGKTKPLYRLLKMYSIEVSSLSLY